MGPKLSGDAIVDLDPDVLLAPRSGMTQKQYDLLDDIGLRAACLELTWTITWEEQIHTVATVLGEEDQAPKLIEESDQEFDDRS